MSQTAMTGIDFRISGVVETGNSVYAVLVNDDSSFYFPVECADIHAKMITSVIGDPSVFDLCNFGLYFTFCSMLKAHGVGITEAAIILGKQSVTECYLSLVEENEIGMKVSRVPVGMQDAMVICAALSVPITVYGAAGKEFAFEIGKGIPKEAVFNCICSDIVKSERLLSIRSEQE